MRLIRHFAAVVVLVGCIVGVGYTWSQSGLASLVSDDRRDGPPGRPGDAAEAQRTEGDREDHRDQDRSSGGLSLSSIDDLLQTIVVEVGLGAVVVIADRSRRKRNKAHRIA